MEKCLKTAKEVKADGGDDLSQGEKNDSVKRSYSPPIPPQNNARRAISRMIIP